MHYRNGREAKNGDKIVQLEYESAKITAFGVLQDATPGNDYCNGRVIRDGTVGDVTDAPACLCDCLHIEDVAALLAEKGLDKRPPGK